MSISPLAVGIPLKVKAIPDSLSTTSFTFVVPGKERWRLRSVVGTVSTAVGGQPNRAYTLAITDGTTTVAQTGAADGGTEPASGTITWADCTNALSAAGTKFSSVAPIPRLDLIAGYHIVGTIINPHAGDAWGTAIVWYEYTYAP